MALEDLTKNELLALAEARGVDVNTSDNKADVAAALRAAGVEDDAAPPATTQDGTTLTSNVLVDGTWYGPDYPENDVTAKARDQITNPAAFEDTTPAPDNRFRADDHEVESVLEVSGTTTEG
jgi:hypothetical protein